MIALAWKTCCSGRATRAATRGDCVVQYRHSKYSTDIASLAKQSSQYGPQIIGTASQLKSETAPAIYHLKPHLRRWIKNNQNCTH